MLDELMIKLHSIGVIKFGAINQKKEVVSPYTIDFSGVVSHPQIAKELCLAISEKAKNLTFDYLCGVPLVGGCLANYIAWENNLPFLAVRSEGVSKVVGSYKSGQRCLLINDFLSSGNSAVDTAANLENEGLEVRDILSFLDLGGGEKQKIKGRGYVSHSIIGISEAVQILFDSGKVPGDIFKLATDFIESRPLA